MMCSVERLAAAFPSLPPDLVDHVEDCASCADAWSGYGALAEVVGALADPPEPGPLAARRGRRALIAQARLRIGSAAVARGTQGARSARAPRVAGMAAAAAVLLVGGSALWSQIEKHHDRRSTDAGRVSPRPPAPPRASPPPELATEARPTPGDRAADPRARPVYPARTADRDARPAISPEWTEPRSWDREGAAPLPLEVLRERWAIVGVGPYAERGAAPGRRAARPGSPRAPGMPGAPGSGAAVAAGRLGEGRDLPGAPAGEPPGDDRSPDDPGRDPGPGDEGGDGDDDEDASCGDALARSFTECMTSRGVDPDEPEPDTEELEVAAECWEAGNVGFEACCGEAPDSSCEGYDADPPGDGTCADVLFATDDQCLAEAGVDISNLVTEADYEAVSHCWIEVANAAFDACCVATPDSTCGP